ncbi:MAG: hypothetical protein AB9842_11490 [Bacteroidales bacterium]
MNWYHYLAIAAFTVFTISLAFHLVRLIMAGNPKEYAPHNGKIRPAVFYSFTGAMSPVKKESAYLHLPTYTAGLIYHFGSFAAIFMWALSWFIDFQQFTFTLFISLFFITSCCCGIAILIKRTVKKELRGISNPDDYISNVLVTIFQLISAMYLTNLATAEIYYIMSAILLVYFPLGKLKHALYFFAARYHLGLFYGSRGVWPPKATNSLKQHN